MVVDLPAPLGPRKPVTRPGSAVNVMSSTAVKAPYFLVSESMVIMSRRLASEGRRRFGQVPGTTPSGPQGTQGRGVPQGIAAASAAHSRR